MGWSCSVEVRGRRYTLRCDRSGPGEHEEQVTLDGWGARSFLEDCLRHEGGERRLRDLHEELHGYCSCAPSLEVVLDDLATRIGVGWIGVFARRPLLEPVPPPRTSRPAASTTTTGWIRFRVIDAETEEPVAGVQLRVKRTTGSWADLTTDRDGLAELRGMPSGTCQATGRLQDARLEDTLSVSSSLAGTAPASSGRGHETRLATIETHRVKTGETLERLARRAGLTAADLAYFNWGTRDPHQIRRHLCNDVGATRLSADGAHFVFDATDEPGLLHVPWRWEASGLPTETTHTVRVRRIARPALTGHVWVRLRSCHDYPLKRLRCTLRGAGREWSGRVTSDEGEVRWDELPLDEDYVVTLELGARRLELWVPWMREPFAAHDERVVDAATLLGSPQDGFGIQVRLLGLGYEPGAVDGVVGPRTRAVLDEFLEHRGVRREERVGPGCLFILADLFGA